MRVPALFSVLCCLAGQAPAADLPAQTAPVTVLLNYEHPFSPLSLSALQTEAQHLLGPTGVRLEIRQRREAKPQEQFSEVLLFQMKGHCSMDALPIGALSDERGALAMAYSSDGSILPFGEVECDRVRQSLQRLLGKGAPESYQSAYGTALGIVMAHEIYHMLSHSAAHTRRGVTKESLSAREMLEGDLSLSEAARLAIDTRFRYAAH